MARKLFCEWNPLTYQLSVMKERFKRRIKWFLDRRLFAGSFDFIPLTEKIYEHKSLIRRSLGSVEMKLQDNKAHNLKIAATKINGVLIKPGEVFSFWKLVGRCSKAKGYREGLIISLGSVGKGIGGGMCQFTNLIHWMILHSPLTVIEHHHHNQVDLFPDYGRQIPFGTGTSIMYNYLDYQFMNNTNQTFQLLTYTTEEYLCGELRSSAKLEYAYHMVEENAYFRKENGKYYRNNEVYREVRDKRTGNLIKKHLIVKNHAKVLYDEAYIPRSSITHV